MCLTDAVNVKLYSRCESVEVIAPGGPRHAGVAVRKCANCAADLQASPLPPTSGIRGIDGSMLQSWWLRAWKVGFRGSEAPGMKAEAPRARSRHLRDFMDLEPPLMAGRLAGWSAGHAT